MTARGSFENEGLEASAAAYIHKPTELTTLLAVIRHHYESTLVRSYEV